MTGPYEVPKEMREMAEKSVRQARQAFEGFIGAVQKGATNVESATENASANMKTASSRAAAIAEANVGAAFDLAEKLVKAKDMQEIAALQSEYLKSQFEAMQAQARELGETFKQAADPKKK